MTYTPSLLPPRPPPPRPSYHPHAAASPHQLLLPQTVNLRPPAGGSGSSSGGSSAAALHTSTPLSRGAAAPTTHDVLGADSRLDPGSGSGPGADSHLDSDPVPGLDLDEVLGRGLGGGHAGSRPCLLSDEVLSAWEAGAAADRREKLARVCVVGGGRDGGGGGGEVLSTCLGARGADVPA